MSSSPPDEPLTPDEELRDDELSKRFYYGGMFGLPWLWIVHAIHFYGKQRNIEAQSMLREENNISGKDITRRDEHCASLSLWNTLFYTPIPLYIASWSLMTFFLYARSGGIRI